MLSLQSFLWKGVSLGYVGRIKTLKDLKLGIAPIDRELDPVEVPGALKVDLRHPGKEYSNTQVG